MSIRTQLAKVWYTDKAVPGEFGIEIETEVPDFTNYPQNFLPQKFIEQALGKAEYHCTLKSLPDWSAHTDNSLRNFGVEYVLTKPLDYLQALRALDIFSAVTKDIPFIENSPGTSVHVHVNIANETFLTFGNFSTLYLLFENVLIGFCGETRRSNLFALPTRVAEPTFTNLIEIFTALSKKDAMVLGRYGEDSVKYAALNLASLCNRGSLEIRSFRGTTDLRAIKEWIGVINKILIYSRLEGLTPRDILLEYKNKGLEFFQEVFGEFSDILRDACQDSLEALIDRNLYYTGRLASCIPDWKILDTLFIPLSESDKYEKYEKKPIKKMNLANQYVGHPAGQPLEFENWIQPNPVNVNLAPAAGQFLHNLEDDFGDAHPDNEEF